MAVGTGIGQQAGDGIAIIGWGAPFTREQINGQCDITILGKASRHVTDVIGEAAILVADQDRRVNPRLSRLGQVTHHFHIPTRKGDICTLHSGIIRGHRKWTLRFRRWDAGRWNGFASRGGGGHWFSCGGQFDWLATDRAHRRDRGRHTPGDKSHAANKSAPADLPFAVIIVELFDQIFAEGTNLFSMLVHRLLLIAVAVEIITTVILDVIEG